MENMARQHEQRHYNAIYMKRECNLFRQRKQRLQEISSAVVLLGVAYSKKQREDIVIVNDINCASPENNIYHYTSEIGREFLSAAVEKSRHLAGENNGKPFRITNIVLNDMVSPETILPHVLYIKSGGGYSRSKVNNNFELIDMLLYSPWTKRYELIRATYDKLEEICFVDITKYRAYVQEYGNPGLLPEFESSGKRRIGWDDLNTESVLKGYGYSVSKSDNLTANERQSLLAEIVDLEILTVPRIVNYLNFFIKTHTTDKDYYARPKWEGDKRFIENYKANPKRFLIAR